MGVLIYGPSYIYGDNMPVVYSTRRPESTLKNKSNYICYNTVHESVAMGESLTGHVGANKKTKKCVVESAGSMCQTCYTTSMMICENLCEYIRQTKCW